MYLTDAPTVTGHTLYVDGASHARRLGVYVSKLTDTNVSPIP